MGDDLTGTLRAVRARLRTTRTVEMAARWTLYACTLACVCLAVSKFLPLTPLLAAALAVLPLAAAAAAAARRIPLRDCAILLDGAFRLDERVATAEEVAGDSPIARAVKEDARRALGAVDARAAVRMRWPREARLLPLAAGLLAALALAPSPVASVPTLTAALEAVSNREAGRLKEAAADPRLSAYARELERIIEMLASKDPSRLREAIVALRALEGEAGQQLLDGGLSPEARQALQDLADRAAGAGAGLGRELEAMGIKVGPESLAEVDARLERAARAAGRSGRPEGFRASEMATAPVVPPAARGDVENALSRRGWAPRYDEIVKRYYEENP